MRSESFRMLFQTPPSVRVFQRIILTVILKLVVICSNELFKIIIHVFYVEFKLFIDYIKSDGFFLQIFCFYHCLVKVVLLDTLVSEGKEGVAQLLKCIHTGLLPSFITH